MADEAGCCLIVTTGGTGPALRDVTPEATAAVSEKLLPGFGELMRAASLQFVPTAILSRQTAGIRGRTLIVNLPGRPKASSGRTWSAVFPAIPYCLDLIGGPRLEAQAAVMKVFRPAITCFAGCGMARSSATLPRLCLNSPIPTSLNTRLAALGSASADSPIFPGCSTRPARLRRAKTASTIITVRSTGNSSISPASITKSCSPR